jgi:GxxExxY protein
MTQIAQMGSGVNNDPHTYAVIGAATEVHGRLGPGFLEHVYHESLMIELRFQGVPFEQKVAFPIVYRGQTLKTGYRADLVCFGSVIVELKALKSVSNLELAQCLNYLKASGLPKGLLLNFGAQRLEYKRVVLSADVNTRGPQMTQIAQMD